VDRPGVEVGGRKWVVAVEVVQEEPAEMVVAAVGFEFEPEELEALEAVPPAYMGVVGPVVDFLERASEAVELVAEGSVAEEPVVVVVV